MDIMPQMFIDVFGKMNFLQEIKAESVFKSKQALFVVLFLFTHFSFILN